MTIPSREDRLTELKQSYMAALQPVHDALLGGPPSQPQLLFDSFHEAAVSYFNEFDRTLDEYSLPEFSISDDIRQRKGEDALNFVDPIIAHWKISKKFCDKYGLVAPIPSTTAYASLQRVIKTLYPDRTSEIRKSFLEANLPTYGFDHRAKHSLWKVKGNALAPLTVGIASLAIGGILSFVYPHATGTEYLATRLLLVLGGVGVAVALFAGTAKLTWTITGTLTLTATGGIALFVLLFYFNPPAPPNPEPDSTPKASSPR